MTIKRGKIYVYKAKEDVELPCKSEKVYHFVSGQMYAARVLILGISEIGIDATLVTINTSWLFKHFDYVEGVTWRELMQMRKEEVGDGRHNPIGQDN